MERKQLQNIIRKRFGGNYKLSQDVIEGGYGDIYELVGNEKEYIVKIISLEDALLSINNKDLLPQIKKRREDAYWESVAKVRNEIECLKNLQGDCNITQIVNAFEYSSGDPNVPEVFFIIQKKYDCLEKYVGTERISESMLLGLAKDICNVLIKLQNKGILHRDIKPSNIFVDEYDNYVLGDFGIARDDVLGKNITRLGSGEFSAPEVRSGEVINSYNSDIYSLGATLLFLVTGLHISYYRSRGIRPEVSNISPAFMDIILKSLENEPEKRYSDAKEMLAELNKIVASEERLLVLMFNEDSSVNVINPNETLLDKKYRLLAKLKPNRIIAKREDNTAFIRWVIITATIILSIIGVIMNYSISAESCKSSEEFRFDEFFLLKRQLTGVVLGVGAIWIMQYLKRNILERVILYVSLVGMACLLILDIMVGRELSYYGIRVIWNYMLLLSYILICSLFAFAARKYYISKVYLSTCVLGITFIAIIINQSTLEQLILNLFVVIFAALILLYYTKYVKGFIAVVTISVLGFVMKVGYVISAYNVEENLRWRERRIGIWLNFEKDYYVEKVRDVLSTDIGVIGKGLLTSVGKDTLISPKGSSMFMIILEELGIIGGIGVVAIFIVLCFCIYKVLRMAIHLEDNFGMVFCLGVLIHISLYVIYHIASLFNLIPPYNVSLPLVSYGRKELFIYMLEIGVVVSIAKSYRHVVMK